MFRSIKVATGTSFSSGTYFPVLVGVYVVFEVVQRWFNQKFLILAL